MRLFGDWITLPLIVLLAWGWFVWSGFAWHASGTARKNATPPAQTGCLTNPGKAALPHGVARRAMPVNWLVASKDVAGLASAAGRYIACDTKVNDPVVQQELPGTPKLSPAVGKQVYSVPVLSRSIEDLVINAGVQVQVLRAPGPAIVVSAPVLAVLCSDFCTALIEVTPAEFQLLMRERPEQLKTIPRP